MKTIWPTIWPMGELHELMESLDILKSSVGDVCEMTDDFRGFINNFDNILAIENIDISDKKVHFSFFRYLVNIWRPNLPEDERDQASAYLTILLEMSQEEI